jgi:phosphoribosylanthranilate isomerase
MTRIKFCGVTRGEDLAVAVELGVDAVGFVLWPDSPRGISIETAARLIAGLPAAITPVGVFVRPSRDEVQRAIEVGGIRTAQIHGVADLSSIAGLRCDSWLAASLGSQAFGADTGATILLDAGDPERYGGTGNTIDWDAAGRLAAARRIFLAGGLTPQNVGEAIRRAKPYGVDVSSGIEDRPGIKNAASMRAFVAAVRRADLLRASCSADL